MRGWIVVLPGAVPLPPLTARWIRADGKELRKVVLRAKDLAARPVKRGG